MKFKTVAKMGGHPEFHLSTRTGPLPFSASAGGMVEARIDEIAIAVGQVPVYMQVPFARRAHLLGAIGGFGVRLSPVTLRLDIPELRVEGVVGRVDGIGCEVKGGVACDGLVEAEGLVRVPVPPPRRRWWHSPCFRRWRVRLARRRGGEAGAFGPARGPGLDADPCDPGRD